MFDLDEIAAEFAELSGADRYEQALTDWCHRQVEYQREYGRDYRADPRGKAVKRAAKRRQYERDRERRRLERLRADAWRARQKVA